MDARTEALRTYLESKGFNPDRMGNWDRATGIGLAEDAFLAGWDASQKSSEWGPVMSLTNRQRREVEAAVRHIGRAMQALSRADIPIPESGSGKGEWAFYDGLRRLGQASNRLIDGLEAEPADQDHTDRSSHD